MAIPGAMVKMPMWVIGNKTGSPVQALTRHRAPMQSAFAGFTLLELIVALAVAGLLLATVPSSLVRAYESSAYRATVRDLVASLKTVRLEAIRQGQPRVFSVDLNERRFGPAENRRHRFPDALELHFILAGSEIPKEGEGQLRFYPDGSATGGSIDLLRPSGEGTRVRIDWLLGRISLHPLPLP
jgi:general secretion pathway protein H